MKRIIASLLVIIMAIGTCTAFVSAAIPATSPKAWEFSSSGQKTYKLYKAQTAPKIDGVIEPGEYAGPNNGLVDNAVDGSGFYPSLDTTDLYTNYPKNTFEYLKSYATYDDTYLYFAYEIKQIAHKSKNYMLDFRIGFSQGESLTEATGYLWNRYNYTLAGAKSVVLPGAGKHERRGFDLSADKKTWSANYLGIYTDANGVVWNAEQYDKLSAIKISEPDANGMVVMTYEIAILLADAIRVKASYEPNYDRIYENGQFRAYTYCFIYVEDSTAPKGFYYASPNVPIKAPLNPAESATLKEAVTQWGEPCDELDYISNVITFYGIYGSPNVNSTTAPIPTVAQTTAPQASSTTAATTSATSTTGTAATTKSATTTSTSATSSAVSSTKSPSSTTKAATSKSDNEGLPLWAIILIIIVGAAIIIGGIVFFVIRSKKSKSAK